jgi:hypothetical protein
MFCGNNELKRKTVSLARGLMYAYSGTSIQGNKVIITSFAIALNEIV